MGYLESIVYANGLFVAVGSNGRIFTSPDGVQWTPRLTSNGPELESVIYVLGQFIAAGDRGTLMTSTNAIDWVEHRFLTRNSFRQIIYARGALWGVGNNEMVVKSGQLQPYVTLGAGPLSGRLVQVARRARPGDRTPGFRQFVRVGNSGPCPGFRRGHVHSYRFRAAIAALLPRRSLRKEKGAL